MAEQKIGGTEVPMIVEQPYQSFQDTAVTDINFFLFNPLLC